MTKLQQLAIVPLQSNCQRLYENTEFCLFTSTIYKEKKSKNEEKVQIFQKESSQRKSFHKDRERKKWGGTCTKTQSFVQERGKCKKQNKRLQTNGQRNGDNVCLLCVRLKDCFENDY